MQCRIQRQSCRRRRQSIYVVIEQRPACLVACSMEEIRAWDWSGLDRGIVGDFLGYISMRSYIDARFMASALVVGKDTSKPSWHFFDWMKKLDVLTDLSEDSVCRFWADEVSKAHEWFKAH